MARPSTQIVKAVAEALARDAVQDRGGTSIVRFTDADGHRHQITVRDTTPLAANIAVSFTVMSKDEFARS